MNFATIHVSVSTSVNPMNRGKHETKWWCLWCKRANINALWGHKTMRQLLAKKHLHRDFRDHSWSAKTWCCKEPKESWNRWYSSKRLKRFFSRDDFHRIKVIHQDWHRHQHQPRKEKIGLGRNKTGNNEKKKNDDFYNGGKSDEPDLKKLFWT